MSDEDPLNQEDLDAMLNDMNEDPSKSESDVEEKPEAGEADSFSEVLPAVEMFAKQSSTVVSTVLNKVVEFSPRPLKSASMEDVLSHKELQVEKALIVHVNFSDGLEGDIGLVVSKKDTAIMADLMMMGDGSAVYEEDHKDALSELVNQIMGAMSTSMGSEIGVSISPQSAQIGNLDTDSAPFSLEGGVQSTLGLSIEGLEASEVVLFLSSAFVESVRGKFKLEKVSDNKNDSSEALDVSSEMMDLEPTEGAKSLYTSSGNPSVDMLLDIPLDVTIELGRADLSIRKILELGPGSIIELDRKATEPVDLLVNDKVVAKGEVVVVDEYFGIRIVALVSPEERIKHLR